LSFSNNWKTQIRFKRNRKKQIRNYLRKQVVFVVCGEELEPLKKSQNKGKLNEGIPNLLKENARPV